MQAEPAAGGRAHPQARRPVGRREGGGHGVDAHRQRQVGGAVPDEREEGVGLGRAGHQLHPFVEEHHARTALFVGHRPVQQHGLAQGVRDVRGDPADDLGLGGGEAERAVLAVQAQVAPAVAADDQRGAQLVAEPDRTHDVAVARARAPRAAGGGVQRPDVPGRAHQLGERVDVVPAQLVVEEQGRHRDQRVFAVRAGEQQGLGVSGGEERGVDRHHAAQRGEHLPLQLGDVEAAAADAQHGADVGHASSVAAAGRGGNPT